MELVNTTAELALDLLERRNLIIPFCRAVNEEGALFVYSGESDPEDTDFKKAEAHQRTIVSKDIYPQKLVGLAFCKEVTLTMTEPDEVVPAIRVELHHTNAKSLVYLFTFKIEDGRATILTYYTRDIEPISLWQFAP